MATTKKAAAAAVPNRRLPVWLAILLGAALVVAMALLQVLTIPPSIQTTVGPGLIVLQAVYGIGPAATKALVKADVNPHVLVIVAVLLTAAAGLLPVIHLGLLPQTVLGAVDAALAGLLPAGQALAGASAPAQD